MAIDSVTMGVSCLLLVPATLFMATNKKVAMNAVKEAGLESSINDNALALAAYYLFLVGGRIALLGAPIDLEQAHEAVPAHRDHRPRRNKPLLLRRGLRRAATIVLVSPHAADAIFFGAQVGPHPHQRVPLLQLEFVRRLPRVHWGVVQGRAPLLRPAVLFQIRRASPDVL